MKFPRSTPLNLPTTVTTLVVVWIDIIVETNMRELEIVTTLVVVWIEIVSDWESDKSKPGHHSRSGVD